MRKRIEEDGILFVEIRPGDRITTQEQREAYERIQNYYGDNRYFTFGDIENLTKIIPKLSNVHLGYLLHLQCYIDYDTGFLKDKKGKIMTKKIDIEKTLGMNESTRKKFTKALEENGILEIVDRKLKINSAYHFRGKKGDRKTIKLFITTLLKLCKTLKPAELGFLYKLLPYVHYYSNMICINPLEEDNKKIQYLNISGISEITGVHEKTVPSFIKKLKEENILRVSSGKDKRHTLITLNPNVFYRRKGKPDLTLQAQFNATPYDFAK